MKRAAIYLRVSTQDQTTSNQEHELRQAAERASWQVLKVYKDHGISGAKGRNGRPAFDTLCRDATKRQFDVVMAWNVDRLGRAGDACVVGALERVGDSLYGARVYVKLGRRLAHAHAARQSRPDPLSQLICDRRNA